MSWLALLFGGAWKKLTSLPLWEISLIAALLFAGLQTLRLKSEQRHSAKVEKQLSETVALVNQLRAQSKVQQQTVTKTIDHYITVTKPEVRTIVQKIESAPLPGGCKTPQAVLDADV